MHVNVALILFLSLLRSYVTEQRYSYIRVAGIIQYSFYKNMSFTLGLLWFSFYDGFTGQTLYDAWVISLYNIIFTSLPPLLYGLFEKDLNEDVINQHAEVYRRMQNGQLFTKFSFFVWMLSGLWHSFGEPSFRMFTVQFYLFISHISGIFWCRIDL
jgi:phospholipid-transporting ATPase